MGNDYNYHTKGCTNKYARKTAIPSWLLHTIASFAHNGRAYQVCIDSSHRVWAVIYIFRQPTGINQKIPIPVFGPIGLRHMPESGIERKLLDALRTHIRKECKK